MTRKRSAKDWRSSSETCVSDAAHRRSAGHEQNHFRELKVDVQSVQPAKFISAAIETVALAAQAKGIRLQEVLDAGAGPIFGDSSRLQQVVRQPPLQRDQVHAEGLGRVQGFWKRG